MTMPNAIPAATLILLRDADGAPPDLLMVERSAAMAFAGGAWVFPGGRVDPGDRALAMTMGAADIDETAARIAAIRETLEEAGLAIGIDPMPSAASVETMRTALSAGRDLGAILADADLTLRTEWLVPFARWRPSHPTTRVFDARFYLARLPDGVAAATVDGSETVGLVWTQAASILADDTAPIIFPTRRTLERLAQFDTVAAIMADAAAYAVRTIVPTIEICDGVEWLCIPSGAGYPVTAVPIAEAMRG